MTDTDATPDPADAPLPESTTAPKAEAPAEETAPAAPAEPAAEEPAAKEPVAKEPAAKKPGAPDTAAKAPEAAPAVARTPPDGHWWWGTGRRKTAVARVRIRPGDGKFVVNTRTHDQYFTEERDRNDLLNVLEKTRTKGTVDVHVNVRGGGYTGQAGAIILGLGRALKRYDTTLEPILRDNGFLTRDPRKVERKKYGQPGARKRFQFSKR